jgi:hypothetical protein
VAILIATAHFLWPSFSLDTTYIVLLVLAVIPWLAPIIKSVELPGGFKIEVQDVKDATDKVTAIPKKPKAVMFANEAQPPAPPAEPVDAFSTIRQLAATDPNLAMVGFRIELERRLSALAQRFGVDAQHRSAGQLLRQLQALEAISPSVASGLSDIIALGNQAAHGAAVSPEAALWMVKAGSKVFKTLDDATPADAGQHGKATLP